MLNLNPNVDFVTEQSVVTVTVQIGITRVRGTRYCDRSYVAFLSTSTHISEQHLKYRGADKSLARPGRKQATAREDFEFHITYF
jgi:hypothetical protein